MQNINNQSVIKAAAIGAGANAIIAILGLLSLVPAIGPAFGILAVVLGCCGWALIPLATGALYGYFTPGKETLQQGALGGAISGVVAGLIFGVINAVVNAGVIAWDSADIGSALGGSAVSLIASCCGAFLVGGVLGAIGGAIWTAVQKD
jgi:hypothetical protein